jgi:hypothetical protein
VKSIEPVTTTRNSERGSVTAVPRGICTPFIMCTDGYNLRRDDSSAATRAVG